MHNQQKGSKKKQHDSNFDANDEQIQGKEEVEK